MLSQFFPGVVLLVSCNNNNETTKTSKVGTCQSRQQKLGFLASRPLQRWIQLRMRENLFSIISFINIVANNPNYAVCWNLLINVLFTLRFQAWSILFNYDLMYVVLRGKTAIRSTIQNTCNRLVVSGQWCKYYFKYIRK